MFEKKGIVNLRLLNLNEKQEESIFSFLISDREKFLRCQIRINNRNLRKATKAEDFLKITVKYFKNLFLFYNLINPS